MKTVAFTLSLALATLTGMSQVSIGPSAFPVPGDQGSSLPFDGEIDPGAQGSGVSWNFNDLVLGSAEINSYVSPQSTDWFTEYPAATVASNDGGDYSFLSVTNLSFEELGTASVDGTYLKYVNPLKRAEFPLEEGDAYEDEYVGTYFDSGTPFGSLEGSIESVVDASGTLEVNNLVYENCIRVHQIQTYSINMGGFISETTVNWYLWFAEGIKFPVLEYGVFEVVSPEMNFTYAGGAVTATEPVTVGVENPDDALTLSVFPNPANDVLTITGAEGSSFLLLDMQGKVIQSGTINRSVMNVSVDNVPSGLYFVRITDQNSTVQTRRVVIQ